MSIRERLLGALRGEAVTHPVYVVYDAFLPNPTVDWEWLFSLGLGQVNHAFVVEEKHPHCEIIERKSVEGGLERRDVTIRTAGGELHEYYLGSSSKGVLPWRMEHFIKKPSDYSIMVEALEGSTYTPTDRAFDESEAAIGGRGITIAHVDRTPFQKVQIDFAGIEAFSCHLADEEPALLELLALMNSLKLDEFACVAASKARFVKLWENIGIDAVGPRAYRKHIVPVYEGINAILRGTGKKLMVHYDGKVRLIAGDIARLGFDLDSLTPQPEGDMEPAEARRLWPQCFFWLHPSLTWFSLPQKELVARILAMASDVGPRRYCFEVSEGVPSNWKETIPAILEALAAEARRPGRPIAQPGSPEQS
ncbi:MAG: hypothetical protein NTU62_10790 [Spirochaetes bacterium]|nr:hypothetical protein [Spirochaetota bacterium]